eukprot:TRINITY_DN795_c0_g1_i1.p5 TRINITY_DN795_c0_g1~~TRINITY_DN795_c0_g1_i1.p5  ORF type:complete len:139 (-),score=11.12 TRINITY_DN795_c0_g1_i1:815-1231(-)
MSRHKAPTLNLDSFKPPISVTSKAIKERTIPAPVPALREKTREEILREVFRAKFAPPRQYVEGHRYKLTAKYRTQVVNMYVVFGVTSSVFFFCAIPFMFKSFRQNEKKAQVMRDKYYDSTFGKQGGKGRMSNIDTSEY